MCVCVLCARVFEMQLWSMAASTSSPSSTLVKIEVGGLLRYCEESKYQPREQ